MSRAFCFSNEDCWLLYVPALIATVCVGWWECMPVYMGYALSVFALVAFLSLVRSSRSRFPERCVWVALGVALLAGEVQVGFATYHRARSFLVCHFTEPDVAEVELHGATPLRAAFMEAGDDFQVKKFVASHVDDGGAWFELHQHIPLGAFEPSVPKKFAVKRLTSHDGLTRYQIQFSAEDDAFSEDFQAVDQSGRSLQALRVMRYVKAKPTVIYEEADPGYPRDAMERVNWDWAVQEP